jgi:cytochrome c biogenesis factor
MLKILKQKALSTIYMLGNKLMAYLKIWVGEPYENMNLIISYLITSLPRVKNVVKVKTPRFFDSWQVCSSK